MSEEEESQALVFDNGTAYMKAGFAGDDAPRSVFPTVTTTKLVEDRQNIRPAIRKRKKLVGDEAVEHKYDDNVTVTRPMEKGVCRNWDHMEMIWHHAFYHELRVAPEEHSTLVTEPVLHNKANREKMCQIFLETFNVPAYYVGIAPVLSLYASGSTTGFVIDFGDEQTQFVPIYEGYAIPMASKIHDIGGYHITQFLQQSLLRKGHDINWEIASAIKEKLLYVAENGVEHELEKPLCLHPNWLIGAYLRNIDSQYSQYTSMEIERFCDDYCGAKNEFMRMTQEYKLPDGSVIELREEQFNCTEVLFNPALIDDQKAHKRIDEIFHSALKCTDINNRGNHINHVVLSGGTSMFPSLGKRLENALKASPAANGYFKEHLKLIVPPERKYSVWIGGSILASLSTFQEMWITRNEYESSGPGLVHRKCF